MAGSTRPDFGAAALPFAADAGGASASGPADRFGSLLANMSLADKVGQMVIAGLGELDAEGAGPPIRELRVGGVVLGNRRNAEETRATILQLQAMADESGALPLLIAIDQEAAESSGFGPE